LAHDVFISYSSKDKTAADAVCARLEAREIRCWIAPRDVQPGANYGAAIIDAIHGSRVMVLVLSSSANASPHIPNEIERAVSRGVAVLPFRIEDVLPAKSLDLFIGSVHWLDALTPPLERHLDQLAESVRRLLLPVPEPLPRPVPDPVPPPRPEPNRLATYAVAVAVVLGLALAGWLALRGGGPASSASNASDVTPPASGAVLPAPPGAQGAVPDPNTGPRAPSAGVARAAAVDIVGCWRWSNNATITIRADGTMSAGPFTGQWRRESGRSYSFTWPEPVDTLAMTSDGSRLNGGNQYGVPVIATRVSGGPDFPGMWSWGGVATVVADARGTVTLGTLSGSWVLADPAQRIYRVTWPKIQDAVMLSDDSSRIQGSNQYGAAVSGVRLPGCA
jgi:hypothetical protein